jgi:hypothetical protein
MAAWIGVLFVVGLLMQCTEGWLVLRTLWRVLCFMLRGSTERYAVVYAFSPTRRRRTHDLWAVR